MTKENLLNDINSIFDISLFKEKFEEVYRECVELNNKHGSFFQIGVYYNTRIQYKAIRLYFKFFEFYKTFNPNYFENKNRDIVVRLIETNDKSRGVRNHFVFYPKDTDIEIVEKIIEPSIICRFYDKNVNVMGMGWDKLAKEY